MVHSCRKTEVFRLVFLCTSPAAFAALQQGGDRSGAEEITGFFFFFRHRSSPFPQGHIGSKSQNSRLGAQTAPAAPRTRGRQSRFSSRVLYSSGGRSGLRHGTGFGDNFPIPSPGHHHPSPPRCTPSPQNSPSAPASPKRRSGEAEFSNVLFVF